MLSQLCLGIGEGYAPDDIGIRKVFNVKILVSSLVIVLAGTVSAHAAGFEILKPHRAVYDVKLDDAEERSGIKGMTGRIVYEVSGNECEGISVRYRFVTKINTGRDTFVTDQQTSTYESPDGKEFSFQTKSFVNDTPDQKVIGSAERTAEGIEVRLGQGEKREFELEDAIFTSTHLIRVLNAAREGTVFLRHDIFDGSGDADKTLSSASVIGKPKKLDEVLDDETSEAIKGLRDRQAWPVTMSYFDKNLGNTAEATPIYEASFYLYGDGVTRQLNMRYQDYSLLASLTEFEYFDEKPCKMEN